MMNATKETNQDMLKMNKDSTPDGEMVEDKKEEEEILIEKPKAKRKRKAKKEEL